MGGAIAAPGHLAGLVHGKAQQILRRTKAKQTERDIGEVGDQQVVGAKPDRPKLQQRVAVGVDTQHFPRQRDHGRIAPLNGLRIHRERQQSVVKR